SQPASQPEYDIELVFLEQRQNWKIDEIPSNIKIHFILNKVESEFLVQTQTNKEPSLKAHFEQGFQYVYKILNSRLLELINKINPDIIIDFGRDFSSFSNFMAACDPPPRIKLLYWIHGSETIEQWKSNPQFYSIVLNKYTHFISISDEMRHYSTNTLENILGIQRKSHPRLYNPINIQQIQQESHNPLQEDESLLKQPFILQVARLDIGKNHLEMLEIYAKLRQKGIREKLYIIGDGSSKLLLQNKINELELENDCLLLGIRDNPYPFMKAAKLFIHTSLFEGLPTVLIESMTCGTPVVAMDCPTGPKEILDNGKYGVLVPLHDQATFVEKTYELLNDEKQYQHYTALLPEAVERFSSENIGRQFLELLASLD
ncbi:glycosyltransferase, partial [Avibacterium avium]|uniref:glycosyltransferase n=1 Tax=Avibacterium avium TaxID=751 RepID=UPI003BF82A61